MAYTLDTVSKKVLQQRKLGKRVGLIKGCFDILHVGHVELFRFAQKHIDMLIIGLDSDETIALTKGMNRPINRFQYRVTVMSELRSVDLVFGIKEMVNFNNPVDAENVYLSIAKKINPSCLITSKHADRYWKIKEERAKHLKMKFVPYTGKFDQSTTQIINKLNS
ncbi:adenylyltransferase/cytidyltransferase family protein [Candidatus Dojkabacteria bacterium]|uniref:Adenylyltransferase/cytidyltransferase family protein n=1 Tax=Candidatus Dojkabacteria bacterium TaxID=2099670 RepID=A0A955I3Q4_9BACT|nr:adenylyltransferase/cytidyltransferase family protein [Candidatus Dojkabacteria bacterium]